MRGIIRSIQFKRDVKLAKKRGKDMAKLRELILLLEEGQLLPPRYKGSSSERRVEASPRQSH